MNHVFMVEWLRQTSLLVNEKIGYLSDLGTAEEYSNFGVRMSESFQAAYEAAAENNEVIIGKQLYKAGKAMLTVSNEPVVKLLATGFMEAGKAARGKRELQPMELIDVLLGFEKGIMKAGKDKKIQHEFLESFHLGVMRLREVLQGIDNIDDAFAEAAVAAEKGCNNSYIENSQQGKSPKTAPCTVIGMYLITTLEQAMKGILI